MSATTSHRLAARHPFLEGIDDSIRESLDALRPLEVPEGTALFDEGQPCQGFPMILAGRVKVTKAAPNGREIPLYRVDPGESCILTSGCLLGQAPYAARGVAERDLTLVVLPPALFNRLLEAHAPFRAYVFGLFAERLNELMQLVEEVAFRKLDQRLAALLVARGPSVRATHQELADELGSVREMVSRLLRSFEDRGLVALGREQVEVVDLDGLGAVADAAR